jgi:hypothetical protein
MVETCRPRVSTIVTDTPFCARLCARLGRDVRTARLYQSARIRRAWLRTTKHLAAPAIKPISANTIPTNASEIA